MSRCLNRSSWRSSRIKINRRSRRRTHSRRGYFRSRRRLSLSGSLVKRCVANGIARIHFRTVIEQQRRDIPPAILDREQQRRLAILVRLVDIRSPGEMPLKFR